MKGASIIPGVSGVAAGTVVRPPTRGGDVRRNWMAVAQLASRLNGLQAGVQTSWDVVSAMKFALDVGEGLHPFKIYSLPGLFRPESEQDPANDWRKFRVRAGQVLGTAVNGTDDEDEDPDSDVYDPDVDDITVPANTAVFWFWIEVTDSGPEVRYGTNPAATRYPASGTAAWTTTKPWTGYPKPDEKHIPIGTVDTLSHASEKRAVIRQLLRTDVEIVSGGTGMRFRGEWDGAVSYTSGDVVVIRTGPNAGCYVCVTGCTGSSTTPSAPDMGGVYWVMLSPGNSLGNWI